MGEVCAFLASQKLKFHSKHRRTPMSPPQLIPPTSPGQVFAGDGRLRRRFSQTGPGSLQTLIVSTLNGKGNLADGRGRYLWRSLSAWRQSAFGAKDSQNRPVRRPYRQRPHLLN